MLVRLVAFSFYNLASLLSLPPKSNNGRMIPSVVLDDPEETLLLYGSDDIDHDDKDSPDLWTLFETQDLICWFADGQGFGLIFVI